MTRPALVVFACVPMCNLFLALALVGAVMVLVGAGVGGTDPDPAPADPAAPPAPRPPYWVFFAVLVVVSAVLFVASFFTEG